MAEMEKSVEGLSELLAQLDTLPVKLERNVVRWALRKAARDVALPAVQQAVPVGRTGELRKSVRVRVRSDRGLPQAMVTIGNKKAWYGHIVERGTFKKPHGYMIRVKRANALFLSGIFRKEVRHPGIKGKFFFKRSVERSVAPVTNYFVELLRARLPREFKKLAKQISSPIN